MVNSLRATTNHVVLKVILGLVAVSLVLTGTSNYLNNRDSNYAAKVNGQQISHTQLAQAVQYAYKLQQSSMGKQYSQLANDENHRRQIRQQVLSRLIDEALLMQYYDKLGLTISNDQIKQAIFAIPAFRTQDKFDNAKFQKLIDNIGLSPNQYAELIRKQLLTQQLIQGIGGTNFLLPLETDRLLALAVQTREARLATFTIATLSKKQTASDNEIQTYYNAHKDQYLLPESFKVSYIPIDTKTIYAKTPVSEHEIQAWYNQYHDEFTIPGRKRYSIIHSKSENDANNCMKQLQRGADFATLAKNHSTDTISAKNGGDIGWISDIDAIDELKQANLIQSGQLSDIIKLSEGFLIIRLDDIQPSHVSPLSAVYDKVAMKVKHKKAIDAYHILQQKVSDIVNSNNDSLTEAEIISGIKAQQTDWFTLDNVPATIDYAAIKQALSQWERLGDNLNIITVDNNCTFIIRITDHRPKYMQPLKHIRALVEQEVKHQKALKQAYVDAEKVLIALKQDKGIEVMHAVGLSFSAPQQFNSINQSDALTQAIFTLPQPPHGKSSYGIVSNAQGDIVLIALDRATPQTLNEQQHKQFIEQLNQEMTGNTFNALLANLRAKAKIKISIST